ncbi:glycosome import protein [Leishmania tarentolae]|uniref:RING-type E3 ubiquitin transferase (cysteine targeting) n=1 Tax=Leishmania tarentolae TaxID=5689 RepID=A0A640KIM4_LEITA|nr:glycosome import protein [Leishmania tarentolae]
MAWLGDAVDAQYTIDTVSKQQALLPSSNAFSIFPKDHVLRVFQLDALVLQQELVEILQMALFHVLDIPPLQHFRFAYQEELVLALDALLYRLSVWRTAQSIGDRLQNLVLRDEERARLLTLQNTKSILPSLAPSRRLLLVHAVMTLVMPYATRKVQRKILEKGWEREPVTTARYRIAKALRYAIVTWSLLSLANTFNFLMTGKYRTLVERILSLRLVYGSQRMMRFTNLLYMNQHVQWQTWMSLFSVLSLGRYFRRLMKSLNSVASSSALPSMNENLCSACHELPTVCQRSNCGHRYCYYCIKSRLLDNQSTGSFRCIKCGQAVHSCTPA